jgi:hypothetical protein
MRLELGGGVMESVGESRLSRNRQIFARDDRPALALHKALACLRLSERRHGHADSK